MSSTRLRSPDLARLGIDVLPRLMRTLVVLSGHSEGLQISSETQFRVLKRLALRPWLVSELAHSLLLSVATVSVAVDSLVRRGLVQRGEAAGDRRAILLSLTPEGVRAFEMAQERFLGTLLQLVDRLSDDDQHALATGLSALARVLDEVAPIRGNESPGCHHEPIEIANKGLIR
ncbi:MAG TPA: MarR family transcriptional regulator [Chloroflexota bacterium]